MPPLGLLGLGLTALLLALIGLTALLGLSTPFQITLIILRNGLKYFGFCCYCWCCYCWCYWVCNIPRSTTQYGKNHATALLLLLAALAVAGGAFAAGAFAAQLGCQAQNILQSHARIFIANLFHKLHPCFGFSGIGLNHFIRFVYVFMPKGEKIYLKSI